MLLGEDGPTHQPIEHLWALRLIPNLELWRPADGPEVAVSWARALRREHGPTAIVLTRQKTSPVPRSGAGASPVDAPAIARGGYVVFEAGAAAPGARGGPVTLVATGSEVGLGIEAAQLLAAGGQAVRVVSMPCVDAFLAQDAKWRDRVLPPGGPRVAIELGRSLPWASVLGSEALLIGLDHFGASAPAAELAKHFGFTPEAVAKRVEGWLRPGRTDRAS